MAYVPVRNAGGYASKGGGKITLHEVQDTAAELSSADGYNDLGIVDSVTWADNTDYTPQNDESGAQYGNDEGNRGIKFTIGVAQRDAAILAIAKQTRNKFYLIKVDRGIVDAKYQEVFAFGQFKPGFEVPLPGGKWSIEFNGVKNDSAITLAATTLTATGTAGWSAHVTTTTTIAAVTAAGTAGYYEITETAV